MHSQVRNKLDDHEDRDYTYIFDHFDDYPEDDIQRRACIDRINEMERWLNEEIQKLVARKQGVALMNPFLAVGYVAKSKRDNRAAFRTHANQEKISSLVAAVEDQIG